MNQPGVHADNTPVAGTPAPTSGLLARLIGVVLSPGETFREIARDPRPYSMLASVSIVSALMAFALFSTEVGKLAWLDAAVRQQETFGQEVGEAQYAGMERIANYLAYIVLAQTLVVGPLITLAIAGILKAAFAVISGAEATFKQTLGVVAASGAVLILRGLFVLPLNYVRETLTSAANLGIFLPMLPEASFAARFLSMIDLFVVWWVAVLAVGLGVLFRRATGPIAATLFAIYGVIALAVALIFVMFGGS